MLLLTATTTHLSLEGICKPSILWTNLVMEKTLCGISADTFPLYTVFLFLCERHIILELYLNSLFLTQGRNNNSVLYKNQAVTVFLTVTIKKIMKMEAGWKSFPIA